MNTIQSKLKYLRVQIEEHLKSNDTDAAFIKCRQIEHDILYKLKGNIHSETKESINQFDAYYLVFSLKCRVLFIDYRNGKSDIEQCLYWLIHCLVISHYGIIHRYFDELKRNRQMMKKYPFWEDKTEAINKMISEASFYLRNPLTEMESKEVISILNPNIDIDVFCEEIRRFTAEEFSKYASKNNLSWIHKLDGFALSIISKLKRQ